MPLTGGVRGAVGDGARVQPVRGGPGPAGQGRSPTPANVPVSAARCSSTAARSAAVRQAVSRTSRVARHSLSCPVSQGGEGVRHFGHEGFGEAQEPAAFGGGFAPGEGDLRADPGPELLRGDPGGGLLAALEQVERDGDAGPAGRPLADFRSSRSAELVDQCAALSVASGSSGQDSGQSTIPSWIARPAAGPEVHRARRGGASVAGPAGTTSGP